MFLPPQHPKKPPDFLALSSVLALVAGVGAGAAAGALSTSGLDAGTSAAAGVAVAVGAAVSGAEVEVEGLSVGRTAFSVNVGSVGTA